MIIIAQQKHLLARANIVGKMVLGNNNKITYGMSTTASSPKQEFNKHFLVRINYHNPQEAYYETYPVRQQFRKQIKHLQDSNKCYIFGGDQFPLQSTQLIVNCDDKLFIEQFLNKNVYSDKKLIEKYQIEEVEKISDEKMKKLSYFYQYL